MAKNSLLKASKDISSFVDNFKKRVARKDPVYPVVSTREIPKAWQGPSVDKTARPRTFAKDVVTLLERLRVKNQDGNAGRMQHVAGLNSQVVLHSKENVL
jgi:hypothetical protein